MVVLLCLITSRGVSPGWSRLAAIPSIAKDIKEPTASSAPATIVAWSLVACGVMMAMLTAWSAEGRLILGLFSFLLVGLAAIVFSFLRKSPTENNRVVVDADA